METLAVTQGAAISLGDPEVMTEIEKLVETYFQTDMTAETFMRKAKGARLRSRSGPDPATAGSMTAPTESATETTSTAATDAAGETTSP